MGTTLTWILAWSTLLWLLAMLLNHLHYSTLVKLVLLPGLLVDSAIRCLVAPIVGSKPAEWAPFSGGKPFVTFSAPARPRIGIAVGVMLRLLLVAASTFATIQCADSVVSPGLALPELPAEGVLQRITETFVGLARSVGAAWRHIDLSTGLGCAITYVLGALILAQSLPHLEFRGALVAWLVLALLGFTVDWIGIKVGFLSRGWMLSHAYGAKVWMTFSLLTALTTSLVVALALFRFLQLLYKRRKSDNRAAN